MLLIVCKCCCLCLLDNRTQEGGQTTTDVKVTTTASVAYVNAPDGVLVKASIEHSSDTRTYGHVGHVPRDKPAPHEPDSMVAKKGGTYTQPQVLTPRTQTCAQGQLDSKSARTGVTYAEPQFPSEDERVPARRPMRSVPYQQIDVVATKNLKLERDKNSSPETQWLTLPGENHSRYSSSGDEESHEEAL